MIYDLLPLMKKVKQDKIERAEFEQAVIDVGVFVVCFILGLVFVIIY